jgi:hypothetical protein
VVGNATGGSLVRVKLWTPEGRIVYSDEHRLIGARFPLEADAAAMWRQFVRSPWGRCSCRSCPVPP